MKKTSNGGKTCCGKSATSCDDRAAFPVTLVEVAVVVGNKSEDESSRVWHRTPLRVPLFEVDLGQAVYHGNYFHLLELGREAFLRDLGYPYRRFMDQQLHLTIVEASCSYRRPLLYDDLIEVQTGVDWWRSRSLAFSQAIYRNEEPGGSVLCTKATLNMVCVRFTGQPTVLPADFVSILKEWVNGGEVSNHAAFSSHPRGTG